jgi:hypothetical protein
MALPVPQISDAAAVIGVRWPVMNPNAIAVTTETPIATSNATTALIRPRALNISLESGMRLSVQGKSGVKGKSGVRSQHFTFHSFESGNASWIWFIETVSRMKAKALSLTSLKNYDSSRLGNVPMSNV